MDPDWLDRKTGKGALLHVGAFFYCIAALYAFVRFALVLPPWLTNLLGMLLIAPAATVFVLLMRAARAREAREPKQKRSLPVTITQMILMAAMVIGLTLPIWIVMYFLRLGGEFWK